MPQTIDYKTLITAHLNSEPGAFEQIYRSSLPAIKVVCRQYLSSEADADDAIQETYVKIYKKLPTLKDPATFPSWSRTVAKNTCLNMIRSRNLIRDREEMRPVSGDDETAGIDDINASEYRKEFNPEAAMDSKAKAEIMQEILGGVSEVQRSCILMWSDGHTYEEIAQRLSMPVGSVKSTVFYTKKKIIASVKTLEKEQGIKLFSMAPLTYFLWLLEDDNSDSGSESAPAAGAPAETLSELDAASFAAINKELAGLSTLGATASSVGPIRRPVAAIAAAAVIILALLVPVGTAFAFPTSDRIAPLDTEITSEAVEAFKVSRISEGSRSAEDARDADLAAEDEESGIRQRGDESSEDALDPNSHEGINGLTPGEGSSALEMEEDEGNRPDDTEGDLEDPDDLFDENNDPTDPWGDRQNDPWNQRDRENPEDSQNDWNSNGSSPLMRVEPSSRSGSSGYSGYSGYRPQSYTNWQNNPWMRRVQSVYVPGSWRPSQSQSASGKPSSSSSQQPTGSATSSSSKVTTTPGPISEGEGTGDGPEVTGKPTGGTRPGRHDGESGSHEGEGGEGGSGGSGLGGDEGTVTPTPTEEPTEEPTPEPTEEPTEEPTPEPTEEPTPEPTEEPTPTPEVLIESIVFDQPENTVALHPGIPFQFSVTTSPAGTTEKVTWSSDNSDIVIDENGVAVLQSPARGDCHIYADSQNAHAEFTVNVTDDNASTTGICGDDVSWTFNDGTLTLSGSGPTYDYDANGPPWDYYNLDIRKVQVESGITRIGEYNFYGSWWAEEIVIPEGVTEIVGMQGSINATLYLPRSLTRIGTVSQYKQVIYSGSWDEWNAITNDEGYSENVTCLG